MRSFLLLFFAFTIWQCSAQKLDKFNLGFENRTEEKDLPDGWFPWGSYVLSTDSLSHSGKYAGIITAEGAGDAFGCIAYRIPAKYTGTKIKLAGYMKTQDVQDGHAGLLLRIDGQGKSLAFNNMKDQGITGTQDWAPYEIVLDYPEGADAIFVAGILVGKGKVWFDDFVVTIDGQDVQTLPEIEVELPKAKLDTAFDKGSAVALSSLSNTQLDNLTLLGRIWGFLKYHHPEIAKGNYNWDYELFRFLPRYVEVSQEADRDKLLIEWIVSLGDVPACQPCMETPAEAHLVPDLSWIEDQRDDLKKALLYIYKNRVSGDHYYIEMASGVGNPNFKNENAYQRMTYPDAGFRLLSLFRYWNIINYFFPYKNLTDKDWSTVLKEYIPIFLDAKDELAYELAVLRIIADVQDTHANLSGHTNKIAEWKGHYFPGFRTQFIEDQLTVTEFYYPDLKEKTGLAIGDVIHQINGQKIADIVDERLPYYPASNKPTQLRNLGPELLRSTEETVQIEFTGALGDKQAKVLNLYPTDSLKTFTRSVKQPPQSYQMLDNNIGYITLQTIRKEDIAPIKEHFKDASGIIIDIRNYPATFVPFLLGSYFVSDPSPFAKFTRGSVTNPGVFTLSENVAIPNEGPSYDGPVVVLVNEFSVSQSEYTAMAFRAGKNTTIMGSTTAGADGNVSDIWLPGGLRTMISGIGVYYPDGTETQRVGIIPDITVKPTINGIRDSRDEPLEKAIEFILGSLWHLQDTTDKVIIEKQKFPFPLFECVLFLDNVNIPQTTIIPSFQAMRDYAVTTKPAIGSQASAGSGSSFDDYALIKGLLPDNVDRQKFLALATVNDSTIIRKPHSSSFNGEIATHMSIDFADMSYKMSDDDRKAMKDMNKSLYMVSSVAYGKKYVIMVESDSVRGSINSAFRKLIGRESLDKTDEETIAASKMLLYYRGGKKESLVAKAEGKEDILTLINKFHHEWDDKDTQYDYPLYYYLMKDAYGQILQYDNSYEYLVKNK